MITIKKVTGKKAISISQIRQIGSAISARPNEARCRMVLILEAHLMNAQAQNGLLKMLEEPPPKTFFVLIADKVSMLLPTIISRCRNIRFLPLTNQQIEHILIDKYDADPLWASIASKTSDADIEKAMMYLNLDVDPHPTAKPTASPTNWITKRKWLLSRLSDIITLRQQEASIQTGLLLSPGRADIFLSPSKNS